MQTAGTQTVHRFFADDNAFLEYVARDRWSGWGVTGDPQYTESRSRLRMSFKGAESLRLEVSRGRPNTSWPARFFARLRGRMALEVVGTALILPGPALRRVEPDLAVLHAEGWELTLQALDEQRMHAVLYEGRPSRLRFAGSLQR